MLRKRVTVSSSSSPRALLDLNVQRICEHFDAHSPLSQMYWTVDIVETTGRPCWLS